LKIQLFLNKNDKNVFFEIDSIFVGKNLHGNVITTSICSTDTRVPETNDLRKNSIGRIFFNGTAWKTTTGKLVTAKHVFEQYERNKANTSDWPNVFEMNVPPSDVYGNPQFADVVDQWWHPTLNHSGQNSTNAGDDWAIFSVSSNSYGYTPWTNFPGSIDIRQDIVENAILRISGYGVDSRDKTKSQTLQTTTGPFKGFRNNNMFLYYRVDVTGGNSGGPIIDEQNGFAVGIVTGPGCTSDPTTANYGTSFYSPEFWFFLDGNKRPTAVLQTNSQENTYIGNKALIWENNQFRSVNSPEWLNLFTLEILKAEQGIFENLKYHNWKNQNTVENFHRFYIDYTVPDVLKAIYLPTVNSVLIKNQFESGFDINGLIKFADPWFIDYPDPDCNYNLRNCGMKDTGPDALVFRNRQSPFSPDFSTQYENQQSYKGVFLNQNPTFDPLLPNYSVQAISPQDITLSQTGKTHRFYFQNWGTNIIDGVNAAEFKYQNALETPVVFKKDGAIAKANFKGTQLSNNPSAFSNNSHKL
jgi:hypothetical protein